MNNTAKSSTNNHIIRHAIFIGAFLITKWYVPFLILTQFNALSGIYDAYHLSNEKDRKKFIAIHIMIIIITFIIFHFIAPAIELV